MRGWQIFGCAAALTFAVATGAHAQTNGSEFLKTTYLTFSQPVEVPGMTLPAGRYMFKMVDSLGGGHGVQVFSGDGKKLYTTFIAVPDQKPSADTPKNSVIMFEERAAGSPQAVKEWFYPGNPAGEEFVYPRKQAARIAKANRTAVLSTPDETSARSSANIARVDENGNVNGEPAANQADNRSAQNQVAQNQEPATPPVGTAGQDTAPRARTLPRTASNLSLFELLSAIALASAFALRRIRKNVSSSIA